MNNEKAPHLQAAGVSPLLLVGVLSHVPLHEVGVAPFWLVGVVMQFPVNGNCSGARS
ncbi:MAG: hypothetical protein JO031_18485, partial [Ktedonobacteraceae bacterium]|nr:hypothetical protein [Ktedonobacteraceae bacterium]